MHTGWANHLLEHTFGLRMSQPHFRAAVQDSQPASAKHQGFLGAGGAEAILFAAKRKPKRRGGPQILTFEGGTG